MSGRPARQRRHGSWRRFIAGRDARRLAAGTAALLMISITAFANELTLDRNTARVGEAVSITVSLEDAFAAVDTINVPVQNLTIDGAPSVSSEFSWINGTVVRRKVFRFTAHPTAPGAALAGPLALIGEGSQREVLPPVAMRVVPDLAAASNDATTILRELVATGRDPFFVVVSLDKPRVHVGEAVVVTWTLYNAANVQDYRITKVPKLPDFWSEELDVRSEVPQHEVVDDRVLQKLVIRRVALFPLRSGRLTIASMEMNAAVMHRIDSGPFGMFEGSLVEVRYPSAQITVDVLPLPPGTSADVIGDVSIACGTPAQKSGGPVVVDVSLAGRANLRGAAPPRWAGSIGGDVQLQEGRVVLDKDSADVRMTRSWKFLIFPERGGRLSLPPLETTAYDPASGERRTLRCEATSLEVSTVAAPPHALPPGTPSAGLPFSPRVVLGTAGTLLATALLALLVMPRLARQQRVRAAARRIITGRSPAEIREQLLALISARRLDPSALLAEEGERGEAWRAVRSILDAVERDRVQAADAEDEIELRVREFVQSLR